MMEQKKQLRPDGKLISSLYNEYADDLRRYLCSCLHNMDDAEDMLHDLFIKVMDIEVIPEKSVHSLLFIMARRMVIDLQRHRAFVRQSQERFLKYNSYMDEDSLARRVESADLLSFEQHYLSQLPVKRASIYKMYKHEEMTAQEIALKLNLSKRTVESHIYLSTKEMKSYLKNII